MKYKASMQILVLVAVSTTGCILPCDWMFAETTPITAAYIGVGAINTTNSDGEYGYGTTFSLGGSTVKGFKRGARSYFSYSEIKYDTETIQHIKFERLFIDSFVVEPCYNIGLGFHQNENNEWSLGVPVGWGLPYIFPITDDLSVELLIRFNFYPWISIRNQDVVTGNELWFTTGVSVIF